MTWELPEDYGRLFYDYNSTIETCPGKPASNENARKKWNAEYICPKLYIVDLNILSGGYKKRRKTRRRNKNIRR